MDIKKKISLLFCLVMLAIAMVPFTSVMAQKGPINVPEGNVSMTVKMGGEELTNYGVYHVAGTEEVKVHVDRHSADILKIGYYYQYADGTESQNYDASFNSLDGSFTIIDKSKLKGGNWVILSVQAVQVNGTGADENGHVETDTTNKTAWDNYRYQLVYDKSGVTPTATATPKPTATKKPAATSTPKPTATTKPVATSTPKPTATKPASYDADIQVSVDGTVVKENVVNYVEPGTIILITAYPKDKVSKLTLQWENDEPVPFNNVNAQTAKIPDSAKPGYGYILYVTAEYTDGKKVGPEKYIFEIPSATPTTKPTVTPTTKPTTKPTTAPQGKGDLVVTYLDKEVEAGSTTLVKPGAEMYVNAVPADKLASMTCRWGVQDPYTTQNAKLRVTVPADAKAGDVYYLAAEATFNGLTKAGPELYKFKIIGEETTPPTNTLQVEPWMEENDDIEELSISLRNDSEETEKANKNIYALNETVTYYIDYKNGGKDIDTECSIKLKLPLEFTVVDADGGTVDDDTIVWTFPNGIKEDEAGTLVVKIKYTALKKSKDYANTIYPSASILKGTKVKDISTVINYIITEYGEKIKVEHEPYMYGDAEADTFRPDYLITRAEGALVLARIYGLEDSYRKLTEDQITDKYTDIKDTYFEAQQAITAASEAGLINGYREDDGTYTYRPNNKMTKAEFIKILACMVQGNAEEEGIDGLEIKELEKLVKKYADTKSFYIVEGKKVYTHWAIEEITLMARLNMLPFLTEDHETFTLDEGVSRAEIAQLVNAYLLRAPAEITSKTDTGFSDVSRKHKLVADIVEATREAHMFIMNEEDGTEIAK